MKKYNIPQPLSFLAVAIAAITHTSSVQAYQIETSNPKLVVRWDNTIRYNLGVRTESQDERLLANSIFNDGDKKFDKGDVITNRIDLLSEFDIDYDQIFGLRLTAAAWYDNAYDDDKLPEGTDSPYSSGRYSDQVSRFINGPSGEILDAFVWAPCFFCQNKLLFNMLKLQS